MSTSTLNGDPRVQTVLRQLSEIQDQMFWTEREVLRVRVGERAQVKIEVSGPFGSREIERLIRLLEAQKVMIAEDENAALAAGGDRG